MIVRERPRLSDVTLICLHTPTMSDSHINLIDNVLILNMNNITPSWTTYAVTFTPQKPGVVVSLNLLHASYSLSMTVMQTLVISLKEKVIDPDRTMVDKYAILLSEASEPAHWFIAPCI